MDWQKLYRANRAAIAAACANGGPLAGGATAPPVSVKPEVLAGARSRSVFRPDNERAVVYVPARLAPDRPAPLVCMLHGCTQDPATFAAATLMNDAADRHGFVVVYPGQSRGSNPQGCWNWFLPEHQRRGAGEPAQIAGIVRDLIESDARGAIDSERVFVAGLSSGGAMAAILAACYSDLFVAVAVHSGLPFRSATDLASAFEAMSRGARRAEPRDREAHAAVGDRRRPVPSIVIHGSADRTVVPANGIQVLRQSMAANHLAAPQSCDHDIARPTRSWRSQVDGGHDYTRSQWVDKRGALMHELLEIHGLGHAWSGGAEGGSYTDARGPSATEAICTFFSLTTGS
jgi:poly(hydroxyalkanoate) depolymerase family esterase